MGGSIVHYECESSKRAPFAQALYDDPVVKSQRLTDEAGNVTAVIELDPWGGETDRCVNQRQQPYRYTTYERDGDGVDQALMRSYHGWWTRFNEPDPWEGSYDLTDPQSFNRYTYVQNDPVNFVDPSGLFALNREYFEAMEALWELWLFGMQMDQRLLPPLVDGPPELPAATLPQIPSGRNEASRELKAVTRAEELLRGNCADFVRSVYNAVLEIAGGTVSPFGITPYPVTFYDLAGKAIPQPTGPDDVLHLYKIALEAGKVSASGRSGGNVVGETVNYNTVRWNKEYYSMSLDEAAVHTIHEAFHQIPNVSDFVLLEAGARVAGIRVPRVKSSSEASRRFNELLFARCGTRR